MIKHENCMPLGYLMSSYSLPCFKNKRTLRLMSSRVQKALYAVNSYYICKTIHKICDIKYTVKSTMFSRFDSLTACIHIYNTFSNS